MNHSQKRSELSRKYLLEHLKLEMLRSKALDRQISVSKKDILEIRKQNISIRLQNNELRLEEPNVDFIDSTTFKETEEIVNCVKNQHQSEEETLNYVTEQMKAVTDVYKHLSDGIKNNYENLESQQYKEALEELRKNIELKQVELTLRQKALSDYRKKWNDEIQEKDSLLEILREIEDKLEVEVKKVDVEPSELTQNQIHINAETQIKAASTVFKKPRTP